MKGASLMKKTLSAKVAIIFLPAIVIFLGIIFVILSAWRNSTSIATEQKNLHLVAVGVESYLQDKDLDSVTKENCMEQGEIDLYNALLSLGQKANVNDIYIMRKTDESLQIIVDTQDDPAVESDRDELFVDYSDAPEELLSAIESDQENFTKKAYEDKFGTSISVFLPIETSNEKGKYIIGVDTDVTELQASVRRSTWLTVIPVFLFCLVCLTGIILIINILFIKPLKKLSGILNDIANGDADLSVHIAVKGEDEIADMAKSFNIFVEHLDEMVVDLKKRAEDASVVQKNLAVASEETTASVTQIHGNTISISKSVDTLNSNVVQTHKLGDNVALIATDLSLAIEKQSKVFDNSVTATETMLTSIDHIAKEMDKVETLSASLVSKSEAGIERMDKTEQVVTDISNRIQGIHELVDMINSIAENTNMLAMNAAIEAAHAGDSGKGFSVVADEIRKLADESKKNAESITKSLTDIIDRTQSAANLTQETRVSFSDIDVSVHETGNAFTGIRDHAQHVSTEASSIKKYVDMMKEHNETVIDSSNKLVDVSGNLKDTGSQIQRLSDEVSGGMSEIVVGMNEIEKAQQLVFKEASKVKEITTSIHDQVNEFKTK
jgi:methyl-accepting chemotaxis protein